MNKYAFKIIYSFLLSVTVMLELFSIYAEGASYSGYYYKRNSENKIALTFDDGPHPVYTEKILDILDKYNVKATFFVVGENAKYYKSTLKDIVNRGHELGNHTFSHTILRDKSISSITTELEKCRNAIFDICGENTVLFRPPGGILSEITVANAEIFENYDIIFWSIDTKDWEHRSAEQISQYVFENIKTGDIVLMHDYIGKDSPTPGALEIIIPELLKRGYQFVTVGDLISIE